MAKKKSDNHKKYRLKKLVPVAKAKGLWVEPNIRRGYDIWTDETPSTIAVVDTLKEAWQVVEDYTPGGVL